MIAPAADRRQPQPVIIWGARGHAKVLNEFLPALGFRVIALFDNDPTVTNPLAGIKVFAGPDGFLTWRQSNARQQGVALVAIGGQRGQLRLELYNHLADYGFSALSVVHPRAFVAGDAIVGAGSQVLANASVCAEAVLGRACIINTNASVDHETVLGEGVHIAPGATVAGAASIGDYSMIGAGAVVLPRIRIGHNVMIGAGAVVTRDVADNLVAVGNPARVIRDNVLLKSS